MRKIITFGTFDMFHIGHLNLLERARSLGDCLVVGVSSDELSMKKKGRVPLFGLEERVRILKALRCVDATFVEESLELKAEYLREFEADLLVMGEDWSGVFDVFGEVCEVAYLPRTPSISTTETIERIRQ